MAEQKPGQWFVVHTLSGHENKVKEKIEKHMAKGEAKAVPVESFIAPMDMAVDGDTIKKGSWVVGVKIKDDAIWKAVQNGELNAFSIGGQGVRIPADPS